MPFEIFPKIKESWKGFSVEDFRDYRLEHFAEMSRKEVMNDFEGGGSKFYSAINKRDLVEEIFSEGKKRPAGYWDYENTLKVARELWVEYGDIPGPKKLKEIDLTTFSNAAYRHFKGVRNLRNMLVFEQETSSERELLEEIVLELSGVEL